MIRLFARLILIMLAALVVACEAAPTPEPPQPTRPLRTLVPTVTLTALPSPTLLPTVTPTALPSATPTVTAMPTAAPTNTSLPPTATPIVAPGMYVASLRIQPDPAPRGEDLSFFPTFLNTTGTAQTFRWSVYIFKSDDRTKSVGETTVTSPLLPTGSTEQKSLGSWKLGVGGPCEDYVARVGFLDQQNKIVNFMRPDGQLFEKTFRVCPASEIPTRLPPTVTPTPAGPIPTPVIPPGLYVVGADISPTPVQHNVELRFTVTFANSTSTVQNFRWRVLIYTSDNRTKSYSDTTVVETGIPIAATDHKSLGYWKLGVTGNKCDEFVARVVWLDQNNTQIPFTQPDGKLFEKTFTVCD